MAARITTHKQQNCNRRYSTRIYCPYSNIGSWPFSSVTNNNRRTKTKTILWTHARKLLLARFHWLGNTARARLCRERQIFIWNLRQGLWSLSGQQALNPGPQSAQLSGMRVWLWWHWTSKAVHDPCPFIGNPLAKKQMSGRTPIRVQ